VGKNNSHKLAHVLKFPLKHYNVNSANVKALNKMLISTPFSLLVGSLQSPVDTADHPTTG
jgi:hypothetical protein